MKTIPLTLVLLFVASHLQAQTAAGRISYFEGDVQIQRAGSSDWIKARTRLPINENDAIKTGKQSRCEIELIEERILRFSENTNATLSVPEGGKTALKASKGSVWVNVKKLANRKNNLDITTSVATAAIRGTIFGVGCDSGKADVKVFRGTVAVASDLKNKGAKQTQELVNAGEAFTLVANLDQYMKEAEVEMKNYMASQEEAFEKYQKEQDQAFNEFQASQDEGLKKMMDEERKAFTPLGGGAAAAKRKLDETKLSKDEWVLWNRKMDKKRNWRE